MSAKDILGQLHHLLAVSSENELVEFKEAKNTFHFDKIGEYFSALANEANLKGNRVAWLVFGVTDTRHIVGTHFRPHHKDLYSLKHELAKHTGGLSFVDIHEVEAEGKRVLLFEIPAAPPAAPVSFKGFWYGRDGESLVSLSLRKMDQIRAQKKFMDWSAETVAEATLDDLDPHAIMVARENFKKKNPRLADEVDAWDNSAFLRNAKLSIGNKLTRTAILLLGKNYAEHLLGGDPKIRWILKDHTGADKDYEIFCLPWILAVDKVFAKIRNIKYRYMPSGTLFPQEVDTYDSFSIREALNNCIAHQDYSLEGRINVIERADSLQFTNLGDFLPGDIQHFLLQDIAPERYRNHFLVDAMRNLNLVDTIGSGIRKMFLAQKERLFPLPEYDFANGRVSLTLIGKVLDTAYAELLAAHEDLTLADVIALDKVQKHKRITGDEAKRLRAAKLIEGRKPNYFLAKVVAQQMEQKAEYTKNAPFERQYYFDLIKKFLREHTFASRRDFDRLLWNKLPDWMTEAQKKNKVTNIIAELRRKNIIRNSGSYTQPSWSLNDGTENGRT